MVSPVGSQIGNAAATRPVGISSMSNRRSRLPTRLTTFSLAVLFSLSVLPTPAQAANPSVNLDQCANGKLTAPQACEWVNGNLGESKSHYYEGESISYRAVVQNLAAGTHTLDIGWDVRHSSKNAIDYLTHFDRISEVSDPCLLSGVSPCVLASPSGSFAVPLPAGSPQPQDSFNALPAAERVVTIWGGGTITGLSYLSQGSLTAAQSESSMRITFTAPASGKAVIAWGGHIGASADWGDGNAAGGISGSPYHMRIKGLDGSGGNQDRSLGAAAVVPVEPQGASLTVVKEVLNDDGGTLASSSFSVHVLSGGADVAGSPAPGDPIGRSYVDLPAGQYRVTEDAVSGYSLAYSGDCDALGFVTLADGDIKTCVLTNSDEASHLIVTKQFVNDDGGLAGLGDVQLFIDSTPVASGSDTIVSPGAHTVSEIGPAGYAASFSGDCDSAGAVTVPLGATRSCTITDDDIAPRLKVTKVVVNDDGGLAGVAAFDLFVGDTQVASGSTSLFDAGDYVVSESGLPGYAASFSGDCSSTGAISLAPGDNKTCTITNDDIAPRLTVVKAVTNDHGGLLQVSDFPLFVDGQPVASGAEHEYLAGSHTVSEDGDDGYAASFSGDCDEAGGVSLAPGDNKTCTITNDDIQPRLTVVKVVTNDNGGQAVVEDALLFVDATAVLSGEQNGFDADAYVVSELGPFGYNATIGGDCAADGSITLAPGDVKSCTITNDDIQPILTVTKVVVNDNGGEAQVADYVLMVGQTVVQNGTATGFDAAAYTVSESGPAGYALTYGADCAEAGLVTLHVGDVKACLLTNDDIQPRLTVVKTVVNDDGGQAQVSDFALFVDGQSVLSGDEHGFDAGSYQVSEQGPSGYAATYGGDCAADGSISLGVGDNKTCTITNDDIRPKLTVRKAVVNDHGGDAVASDWDFFVDATQVALDAATGFSAGSYQVSEASGPSGYALSYSGDCDANGTIQLFVGDDKECTLTNDDIQPKLTVHKDVILDDGGLAEPSDWDFFVDATQVALEAETGFDAGLHQVSESGGPSGYALSYSGDCDANGTVAMALGQSYDCTLINDDIAPILNVTKVVVNDNGGDAEVVDFALSVGQESVVSGVPEAFYAGQSLVSESGPGGYALAFSGDCDAEGAIQLDIGQSYDCILTNDDIQPLLTVRKAVVNDDGGAAQASDWGFAVDATSVALDNATGFDAGLHQVSESGGPSGYALSYSGDCDANGTVQLEIGGSYECTLTNDDIQPLLTLRKTVINDDGGLADADDWDFFVDDAQVALDAATGFDGGSHQVSEASGPAGYALGFSGDCDANGTVLLAIGESYECTLTNDDIEPRLTVLKVVVNDNGGLAVVNDTSLFVDEEPVESGVDEGFDAGSYQVSELGPPGYAPTFSGDCNANGTVSLAVGDEPKLCVLTNDDVQPILVVTKLVINDDGGAAEVEDFALKAGTEDVASGVPEAFDAGTYSVSESGPSGYAASFSGDCDANGTVRLAVGEEAKHCILTNDDIQPKLTLHKRLVLDDGGSASADDWDFFVDAAQVQLDNATGFSAGSYQVSESGGPSGYSLSFEGDCDANGTIQLAIGESYDCTLVNDDIAPLLTLHKRVVNDDGGAASADDWDFAIDASPALLEVAIALPAGSHSASESGGPSGYALSFEGDCDANGTVAMALGQSYDCTLVNDDIQPRLTVTKLVVNDNGGLAIVNDTSLFVGAQPVESGVEEGFDADTYLVSELGPPGYAPTFSGDCDANGTIQLAIGESYDCILTNDDIQPILTLHKRVVNDDGGSASAEDWDFAVDGSAASLDAPLGLDAGSHSASESGGPSGYALSFEGDCDANGTVVLDIGDVKSCTLVNDDIAPLLTLHKRVVNDNGGQAAAEDWDFAIDGSAASLEQAMALPAGSHAVSESGGPSGYALSFEGDCDANGTIQLAIGESYDCTLVNDDIQPRLLVDKRVINDNGGSAQASAWSFFVDATQVTLGQSNGFDAGTYRVSESGGPAGYSLRYAGECAPDGNITLRVGDVKRCLLVNDDRPAMLMVIKHVINDSGGNATAGQFSLHVAGTDASPADFPGNETGTLVFLDAGAFAVSEAAAPGYVAGYSGCSGTIALGELLICTVTNNDAQPRMTGGGTVGRTDVRHGFELHCNAAVKPNNLEVNWGKGQKFHLERLTSATCIDDQAIKPRPPAAPFDTYIGKGTGRYNGVSGATIEFTFTDAGEPGKLDTAKIVIKVGSTTVLNVSGNLASGNQQAHK